MHPLLRRQLRKAFGETVPTSPELAALLASIDEAYAATDDERRQLERSLFLAWRGDGFTRAVVDPLRAHAIHHPRGDRPRRRPRDRRCAKTARGSVVADALPFP